jgi:hypothetical protein
MSEKCGGEQATKQAEDRQALRELRVWLEHQSEARKGPGYAPDAANRWCGALNRFMDAVEEKA